MSELDPYAVLGVPRSATRLEIARAYRKLAKRLHPDAAGPMGAAHERSMARINEAWHTLSDAARRARWDALHPPPATRPVAQHGAAVTGLGATVGTDWRNPRVDPAPRTMRDSGWFAVAVIAAAAVVLASVMIVLAAPWNTVPVTPFGESGVTFESAELSFRHPSTWTSEPGADAADAAHRVVVHLVNSQFPDPTWCVQFDTYCALADEDLPSGAASVIVTAWSEGTPPEPDPMQRLPAGLDARLIGGAPAAFRLQRGASQSVAWWQLSPPDFPDAWLEVRADIAGDERRQDALIEQINQILATVEFRPG